MDTLCSDIRFYIDSLELSPLYFTYITIAACTKPMLICQPLTAQNTKFAIEHYQHLRKLKLADYHYDVETSSIDILIGSDFYWSIFENDIIRGKEGEPVALKSKLGYIRSGPMQYESCNNSSTLTCHVLKCQTEVIIPEEDLAEKLNKF